MGGAALDGRVSTHALKLQRVNGAPQGVEVVHGVIPDNSSFNAS